jgi:collagenase-like PrtC family protease
MKFSVGYSVRSSDELMSEIIRVKDKISEVYFSFGTTPSGRNDQTRCEGFSPWEAQAKQIDDLNRLHREGLKFNLLFNANCYGEMSQSKSFFKSVGEIVDYIKEEFSLSSVTTTSPLIAKFIKQNFKEIDVRASVNMSVGSVIGMEYIKDYFDSFYVKRELNRNFHALKELRRFCDANGKEIYLLANSGCLNDCSLHTFHDNLVAHESEIAKHDNGYQFTGICREYLSKNKDGDSILSATNFIRPEDTEKYEGLVPSMKLATRVHERPSRIIRAYIERRSFSGNVLSLLEPNHSNLLYPYVVENSRIASRLDEEKLIYSNEKNAFLKLEETYAYQQND